jgi:putative Mg2+ transporter-C (MgtC) family protein
MDALWQQITAIEWPKTEFILRVLAAIVFGGVVGIERELRDKPAGFRTIILICVGACVFTIISQAVGGSDWESTRIAAQIVSGIGFLGAGAILRERASIIGLTTAATIWAVAAIGMAAGYGLISLGALGTVVILVALFGMDYIEHWVGERRDIQEYLIETANRPAAFGELSKLFKSARLQTRKRTCYEDGTSLVFFIVAMGGKEHHEQMRKQIAASKEYTLRKPFG